MWVSKTKNEIKVIQWLYDWLISFNCWDIVLDSERLLNLWLLTTALWYSSVDLLHDFLDIHDSPRLVGRSASTRRVGARKDILHSWFGKHWAGSCTSRRSLLPRRGLQLVGFWGRIFLAPWGPRKWLQRKGDHLYYVSSRITSIIPLYLHIAATIWVSRPYWLEKPPAK